MKVDVPRLSGASGSTGAVPEALQLLKSTSQTRLHPVLPGHGGEHLASVTSPCLSSLLLFILALGFVCV